MIMAEERDKTILVTGGLGFIGGHFIELAFSQGYNVINVDKITYASDTAINDVFLRNEPHRYRFFQKDVNDLAELPYCGTIVHFAAESHVDNSIRDGDVFVRSNVLGTQNILNLLVDARRRNVSHAWAIKLPMFIYVSTDEVFGDREQGFFKEEDRHNPSNPYSASKAMAEMLVASYGRTYGLPYMITRTANNYGERQHQEKLIPHCIAQALAGRKIKIHGSGTQSRTWIYVKDNCEAIWTVMTKGKPGETYHIASSEEYAVNDVARIVLEHFGRKLDRDTAEYVQDRSGQDMRYALDYSKIANLGWTPRSQLTHHIKEVIRHYEEKYKKGHWPAKEA